MPDQPARQYNVLDCETTGFDGTPELMEIGSTILTLTADRETTIGEPVAELFRPTCPIEPGARATHHITAAQVAECPVATVDDRVRFVTGAVHGLNEPATVFVAHNVSYELQFFGADLGEMRPLCTYKAALRVFPDAPSHGNGALYYYLQDLGLMPDLGKRAHPMHRAGPDTLITAHLLAILLKRATTQEMLEWTQEPALLPTCPIGDFKGKPWSEVEFGFLRWMAGKEGMEEDFRWNARRELERRSGQGKLL